MKLRFALFIPVLIIICLAATGNAQFEGAAWDTLTSDTLQHYISQDPLAATPAGLHMTYARSRGPGAGWIIYYRFLDCYGAWDDPVVVEQSIPAFEPSIAAREFGTFKIAILYDAAGDIYGDVVSSPWEIWDPVNLTNSPDADFSVTSAIDFAGTVHLSWITEIGGEYKIAYGTLGNSGFNMEILQESDLGDFGSGAAPFMAVVDTIPHIFYRGVNNANYHVHHASKPAPDSSWEIEFLYTPDLDDFQGSASVDNSGEIHLAISGNTGWGTPGHIYYLKRSYQTGNWSAPELVTGSFSVVDGHIGITNDGVVFVAGAGVSGNIYTGDIYLSENSSGTFDPEFLVNYPDGTCPALAFLPGPVGTLLLRARISHPGYENEEIIYYGPQQTSVGTVSGLPKSTVSCMNYPNPFNSGTIIYVSGITGMDTRLRIFYFFCREIIQISPYESNEAGSLFQWDGTDNKAGKCPSGTYFYLVGNSIRNSTGRMILLK